MKKILIALIAAVVFSGCMQSSLQFSPTVELKGKYDNSARGSDITVYYNTKQTADGKVLQMAVHNSSGVFMSNLIINYDECCQNSKTGPGSSSYTNLGNIKNRSYKTMNLKLTNGSKGTLKLRYTYLPVREDGFLMNTDSSPHDNARETTSGEIILYVE